MTLKKIFRFNVTATILIVVTVCTLIYIASHLDLLTYLSIMYNFINIMQTVISIITAGAMIYMIHIQAQHKRIELKEAVILKQGEEKINLENIKRREEISDNFIAIKSSISDMQFNLETKIDTNHRKLDNKIQLHVINQNTFKNKLLYLLHNVAYNEDRANNAIFKGVIKKVISAISNTYSNYKSKDKKSIDFRDKQNIEKELVDIILGDGISQDKAYHITEVASELLDEFNRNTLDISRKSSDIILDKFEIFLEEAYTIFKVQANKMVIPNRKAIEKSLHDFYYLSKELEKIASVVPEMQSKQFILIQSSINNLLSDSLILSAEERMLQENKLKFEVLKFLEENI